MASATWGEITLAEGFHDWGRLTVPLLDYTLAFALQLRKSTENLSQGRVVVGRFWKPFIVGDELDLTVLIVGSEERAAIQLEMSTWWTKRGDESVF
jgi:hypothetical protein